MAKPQPQLVEIELTGPINLNVPSASGGGTETISLKAGVNVVSPAIAEHWYVQKFLKSPPRPAGGQPVRRPPPPAAEDAGADGGEDAAAESDDQQADGEEQGAAETDAAEPEAEARPPRGKRGRNR